MNRRPTVVYIILLLVLVGAYIYLKNRGKSPDIELTPQTTSEATNLFLLTEGSPTDMRIQAKSGEVVEVKRDEAAGNSWKLIQPAEVAAEQGAAEAAASQVMAMSVTDIVPSSVDPKIMGLEEPEYVLFVKLTGGKERTFDIGVLTPSESGYYVRDREEMDKVVIVSSSAIDSLINLLRNPPYLETPTPLPESPTPEAGPASEATATPQP